MGYTTEFRGQFNVTPTLKPEHADYLRRFAETRRMKRNARAAKLLDDPVRIAAGLSIGTDGEYFTGGKEYAGQGKDESIVEYNASPESQPSLWCQWVPNDDGSAIEWDEGEKFYCYIEWLDYLIHNFLKPWGYTLNGEVEWRGEDWDDTGRIIVDDNVIDTRRN